MTHFSRLSLRQAILLCSLSTTALPLLAVDPAQAPASLPKTTAAPKATAATAPTQQSAVLQGSLDTRVAVDRLLRDARDQQAQGNIEQAISLRLEAGDQLRRNGFERDQIGILRDMTLDPDPAMAKAGGQAMAEMYYQKYLKTRPRDAQWLLEALAWANYCGDPSLLERFRARKPDKAHENIDERGRKRGEELKADDQLFLAAEMIRLNRVDELKKRLQNWPYPIDRIHSVQGTSLLHSAVWYKKTGIARMLVEEYHANVNVTDLQNDTPLDYAEYQQVDELVKYLKSKHAKSNKTYGKDVAAGKNPATPGQPSLEQLKKQSPAAPKQPADKTAPTAGKP